MENMMQQTIHSEGSESYRSSSSLSNNEELVDYNINQSVEGPSSSKQFDDQLAQECSHFNYSDLDTMMQNYKQIGGELELNLKILENKRVSLNKILIETGHECEILNQQKECQKKNLVDLQIRLENLDTEKMNIWKENQKDKCEKTETIKQEMQMIFENEAYINNTYTKFNEILKIEKNKCEEFLSFSKHEAEMHKKEGENYINKVRRLNNAFKSSYEELLKLESKTIKDLEAAILTYKSIIESRKILQEKLSVVREELETLEKDSDALRTMILQKKEYIDSLQNKHRNLENVKNDKLNQINNHIGEVKTRYANNVLKIEESNKKITEAKRNLQFIENENSRLNEDLLNYEVNNKSDNQELNRLVEECSCLKFELTNASAEQGNLEAEIEILPELTAQLRLLEITENELTGCILSLTEEETLLKAEEKMKHQDYENINVDLVASELETFKMSLNQAQTVHCDLTNMLQEQRTKYEKCIREKEKELDEVKQLIIETKITFEKLENQTISIESDLETIKNEMANAELMMNETKEEDINLQHKEEESKLIYDEIMKKGEDIIFFNDELKKLETEIDENLNLDDLEVDLNRVAQQIKEATNHYENQIETIKTSFQNQEKTFRDKSARDIGEIERKSRKEEAHEKRVSIAVPRLNAEITNLEKDLKNLLPGICKEIKTGLDILEELANCYRQSFESKEKKGKAATIRNLSSIEEQLASPMKCLMTLEYIPQINLNPPTKSGYQEILKVFREKFTEATNQLETTQPLEMANKLQEMGSCLFGKKYVKPSVNLQVLNDTEISSSTEVYY